MRILRIFALSIMLKHSMWNIRCRMLMPMNGTCLWHEVRSNELRPPRHNARDYAVLWLLRINQSNGTKILIFALSERNVCVLLSSRFRNKCKVHTFIGYDSRRGCMHSGHLNTPKHRNRFTHCDRAPKRYLNMMNSQLRDRSLLSL